MVKNKIEEIGILDKIIIGRVRPKIYAFTTNTIPNHLKIGDTYRSVSQRLNEWKVFFPNLKKQYESKAMIDEDIYFRDYSVHQYLENDLKKNRLLKSDLEDDIYYSKEFFKDTNSLDIDKAIKDIKENYIKNTGKYEYYSSENKVLNEFHYERKDDWELRPNQLEVVNNFSKAIKNGRRNLLMYAVMRFGKSFTSLCCALKINANLVLVVSAKADVKDEWKKTVESAVNFKEYTFLESKDLLDNENLIQNKKIGGEKIVLFLTLQDLQGNDIKDKHKELFSKQIDLLIVDETHFGARAESFGKILKDIIDKDDDSIDTKEAKKIIKKINAQVRLHLSGTPYRILMGSEFEREDIISFVQFSDIARAQEEWDKNNLNNDEINEWDNPYFGFPQMIRFAFNPNKSARKKMEELKKSGVSFAFSKLFETLSIKKDNKNNTHRKFQNEFEIMDLLKVIDGTKEDENLLGFLDYDKIKDGKMCRHMVMVLPYCSSCDAMEDLIISNKDIFKNLNEYEIINISGLDASKKYKNPYDIKNKIKDCELKNKKTITLTVNRMLTGSTVEQWDTMLYFKDTSSPQEYDQAIFRLQNQYIRTLSCEKGIIKENLKPQTLLVDFDPDRLFRMQEQKSLIYNVNIEKNGNLNLKERIIEELRISPVITMNNNKIKEVEANNILEAISSYNNKKSISDEVNDIPVDLSILNDIEIRKIIEKQGEFNSKQGLTIKPYIGNDDDLVIDESLIEPKKNEKEIDKYYIELKTDKEIKNLEDKIKTYYQRLLFFSFLSKDNFLSLDDIINVIDKEENIRLSKNLEIDKYILEKLSVIMDPFKRSKLDYKIQNISTLSSDENISSLDRALTSLKKFNRMSESEIITPLKVCYDMVNLIPEDGLRKIVKNKDKILDIASKSGEYAVAIYQRLVKELGFSHDEIKDIIYSIPTSSIAYEFTRRFYEILDLNVDNIAINFNSYDLINIKDEKNKVDYEKISNILKQNKKFNDIKLDDEIKVGDKKVEFGIIIGNPPYQKNLKGTSDKQIYQDFMEISYKLSQLAIFISPGKFLFNAGKTPKLWNQKMLNDKHLFISKYESDSKKMFPDIDLSSSLVITVRNEKIEGKPIVKFYPNENIRSIVNKVINNKEFKSISNDIYLQSKFNTINLFEDFPELKEIIGSEKRLITSILQKDFKIFTTESNSKNKIKIYGNDEKGNFIFKYINRKYLDDSQRNIENWKIVIAATNGGAGNLGEDKVNIIGIPRLLENNSGFTQTFISIGNFNDFESGNNLLKYFKTKFVRFMIGTLKATQRLNKEVFENVPVQNFKENFEIDWSKSISEIDEQLFNKYGLTIEERNHIKTSIKEMK